MGQGELDAMTAAGDLSHRITFQRRAVLSDGYGNSEGDYQEEFTVWAARRAKLGGETVTAARLSGQQPVLLTVRQSSQTDRITEDWRAVDSDGKHYNIRSIVDPDDSGAYWELLCQTGTGVAT